MVMAMRYSDYRRAVWLHSPDTPVSAPTTALNWYAARYAAISTAAKIPNPTTIIPGHARVRANYSHARIRTGGSPIWGEPNIRVIIGQQKENLVKERVIRFSFLVPMVPCSMQSISPPHP
jgi:hypothetical protein